ncbi:MAG TPA: hypothetical protein VG842_06775 [Sediminibacterium sp.]|nr:hypothetical protein [Sediminibacterium sp.]
MKPIVIVILGAAALGGLLSRNPFVKPGIKPAVLPVPVSQVSRIRPSKILAGSALLAEQMILAYYW